MADVKKLKERYGASENGNYFAVDTIGVPHPYCITPGHVSVAQDFSGIISEEAILTAEASGRARCGTCWGKLSFKEHELALLIRCMKDLKDKDNKPDPELHEYLKKCVPLCEEDHYAGFAFLDGRGNQEPK